MHGVIKLEFDVKFGKAFLEILHGCVTNSGPVGITHAMIVTRIYKYAVVDVGGEEHTMRLITSTFCMSQDAGRGGAVDEGESRGKTHEGSEHCFFG